MDMVRVANTSSGVQYWPAAVHVSKDIKLDPRLSPMENCWRIIDFQTLIWLTKARVWSRERETLEELIQDVRIAVYMELRRRVVEHTYSREHSFWLNVRSCAWSIVHKRIKVWIDAQKQRENIVCANNLIQIGKDEDDGVTYYDLFSTGCKYITESESKEDDDWRSRTIKRYRVRMVRRILDDEYHKYLDDCEEFGIKERLGKIEWLLKNYEGTEELALQYGGNYKGPWTEYRKTYTMRHPERVRESIMKWRGHHRDEYNAYQRAYRRIKSSLKGIDVKSKPSKAGRPKKVCKTEAERRKQEQMHQYYIERKAKKEGP